MNQNQEYPIVLWQYSLVEIKELDQIYDCLAQI
ncbi:MAG: DUF2949 domain-containing protein [cyanobacterium endosymbiont of Rhopalodia sterrenbergii]